MDICKDFKLNSWDDKSSSQAIISLWATRVLLELKVLKKNNQHFLGGFNVEEIFELLDLTLHNEDEDVLGQFEKELKEKNTVENESEDDFFSDNGSYKNDNERTLNHEIRAFLIGVQCELVSRQPVAENILLENIQGLSQLIKLNSVEQSLVVFFTLVDSTELLSDCLDVLGNMNKQVSINCLSIILDIPSIKISKALSSQGVLQCSGLLKLETSSGRSSATLKNKVRMLDGISNILLEKNADIIEAMQRYFERASTGDLSLSDFSYLEVDIHNICHYLKNIQAGVKGVNILLYGDTGVGKTMLVNAISQSLELDLFEVATKDEEGEELRSARRIDSYRLSQEILKEKAVETAILFDECEDVWPAKEMSFMGMMMGVETRSGSGVGKGWMNKMLESNSVPTFWIANKIQQIDPAYLRRIDYIVEVPNPPRAIRQNIVSQYLQGIDGVSHSLIKQVADHKKITPAHIATVSKVIKTIFLNTEPFIENSIEHTAVSDDSNKADSLISHLLNNILDAQGESQLIKSNMKFETPYDLNFLNTDVDIKRLVQGVKNTQQGRFCLWGEPGVGKTAFAKHIALVLDKEVITKKASDLLDPYVGMTEKNIARAFKDAKRSGAILQIDEADSFLSDRKRAHRSWEASQVNQMLSEIENFEGIFIASSNLINHFDEASIRRFDLKIHFDFLKSEQTWLLFQKILLKEGLVLGDSDEIDLWQKIKLLELATPGDFYTCLRRIGIMGETLTADKLLQSLQMELSFKKQHKKNVHNLYVA